MYVNVGAGAKNPFIEKTTAEARLVANKNLPRGIFQTAFFSPTLKSGKEKTSIKKLFSCSQSDVMRNSLLSRWNLNE
jgi:hypothetical protein